MTETMRGTDSADQDGRLTSPSRLRRLLGKYGVTPNKRLGQNFLVDENHLRRICELAELSDRHRVLEIGAGAGTLTQALAARAAQVCAIEYDRRLLPVLRETLQGCQNVRLIHGDALALDLEALMRKTQKMDAGRDARVVANLPYYLTTPLLFKLLEGRQVWDRLVVMVQREVAERITAQPGGKEYGALSVAVQYCGRPRLVAAVPPTAFFPKPEVASSVIVVDLGRERETESDPTAFFAIVRAAFGQRRKTLDNALAAALELNLTKREARGILAEAGIDAGRRAETLSVAEFQDITRAFLRVSAETSMEGRD